MKVAEKILGSRLLEILGLPKERCKSLTIQFGPEPAVEVHAVYYAEKRTIDAVFAEIERTVKLEGRKVDER